MYKEYLTYEDNLSQVKGKILVNETIKNRIIRSNKIFVSFDELSVNNLLNQVIKCAIYTLLKSNKLDNQIRKELKGIIIFFDDVDLIEPSSINWKNIRYNRINSHYKMLVYISEMIINSLLLSTEKGEYLFNNFIDEERLFSLYEKFIFSYFKTNFKDIEVTGEEIYWAIDDDFSDYLPKMKTDITLKYKNKVLIIDAKYYSSIFQSRYDKNTYHSGNMYQIFSYVNNYKFTHENEDIDVSGMLLYAKTNDVDDINNTYSMHGNKISVRTLDLNQEFDGIEKDLNDIVHKYFCISTF